MAADGSYDESTYLRQVAQQLRATGHGGKSALVKSAASFLGISVQTMHTRLRAVGYCPQRKLRTDKGDSRVTREEVVAVAGLMAASMRANNKQLLAVGDAMKVAMANNLLATPVAPATMLRLMRQHNCHPAQVRQATPHARMRSLHPNHVWQLDASICVLYRLRGGKTAVMDQRKFNARKPANLAKVINERILRYAVTDHTSGAVYARYYLTAGETQATLFDFLMEAFRERGRGLMYGVPHMLVWDAGSANQAHGIRNLLTGLAIRHWAHKPGNPRAKGQVECTHNVIERKFEGLLTFVQTESLEQLNAQLDLFLADFNGNQRMDRHGHTRWGAWTQITQEQLRLCPPRALCEQLLMSRPQTRKVIGSLEIAYTIPGYPAARYSVAAVPGVRVGDEVTVMVNPYHVPNVYVLADDESGYARYHECTPVAEDRFGMPIDAPVFGESYKSPADTTADSSRKQIYQRAYGVSDGLEAQDLKAKGRVAFDGTVDPFKHIAEGAANVPDYIKRRGTELEIMNPPLEVADPRRSATDLLAALRTQLDRPITREESAALLAQYPDGLLSSELDAAVAAFLNPPAPVIERPRLVAVK